MHELAAHELLGAMAFGWDGPSQYNDRFGHPRLRMLHIPFAIGIQECDQWLQAIGESGAGAPEKVRIRLNDIFCKTADWMRNTP